MGKHALYSRDRLAGAVIVLAFVLSVAALAIFAGPPTRGEVNEGLDAQEIVGTGGLSYGGLPHQTLDIYLPELNAGEAAPTLVHVGRAPSDLPPWVLELTEIGWAVANVNYASVDGVAVFPAAVADVIAATDWLRDNAHQLNIQADNVALAGEGVGGLVAGLAASDQDKLHRSRGRYAGLLVMDAPLDTSAAWWSEDRETQATLAKGFGCALDCGPAVFEQFSVTAKIGATFPPMYLAVRDGSLLNAITIDAVQQAHRERGETAGLGVWIDTIDATTGSPLNRIQLQLFLSELASFAD